MHQQKQAKETTANKEEEPQNEQSKIPKRHMQKCTNHNIKVVKKKRRKRKFSVIKTHNTKPIPSLAPTNHRTQNGHPPKRKKSKRASRKPPLQKMHRKQWHYFVRYGAKKTVTTQEKIPTTTHHAHQPKIPAQ